MLTPPTMPVFDTPAGKAGGPGRYPPQAEPTPSPTTPTPAVTKPATRSGVQYAPAGASGAGRVATGGDGGTSGLA